MTELSQQDQQELIEEFDVVLVPEFQSHIVYPKVPEDMKALALCGKKWKPEAYNGDVEADVFICHDCVDAAVALLVETDHALLTITRDLATLVDATVRLSNLTEGTVGKVLEATPMLNAVVEDGQAYADKQEAKVIARVNRQIEKAEAKRVADEAKAKAKKKKKKGKK